MHLSLLGEFSPRKLFADGEKTSLPSMQTIHFTLCGLFEPFLTQGEYHRTLTRTQLERRNVDWFAKLGAQRGNTLTILCAGLNIFKNLNI